MSAVLEQLDSYIETNGGAELQLRKLLPIRAVDVQELAAMQFKPRDVILAPWLHTQDLCMVFAARGIGKTHLALGVAYAVASGGELGPWHASQPRKVLYLDGELPGVVMQERARMHCTQIEPACGYLRIFTPDLLPDGYALPDLSTRAGQEAIDPLVEDAELIIVDNLSAWARTGRENEAESWQLIADWILRLRRRGIAVLLIHHAGKNGAQRGTSKREDLLDAVLSLSRPVDYDASKGAVFVVEFTKARHLTGADAASLELAMTVVGERAVWICRTAAASMLTRVVALSQMGYAPNEMAMELGIDKSNVSRYLGKARTKGLLQPKAQVPA